MRKIGNLYYITHRQQAAAFEPVGNPFGGPAFGERRGPAIAIVGAVGSVSAGMAIGGLVGGLMIAGGALSAIGMVTGNETLSKLGTVASLAGGIGSIANGSLSNLFGGAAETATTATGTVSGGSSAIDAMQAYDASTWASDAGAYDAATWGAAESASSPVSAALGGNEVGALQSAIGDGGGLINSQPLDLNSLVTQGADRAADVSSALNFGQSGIAAGGTASAGGISGLVDMIKKNPELTRIVSGVGEGLMKYMSESELKDAMVGKYQTDADLNRLKIDLAQRQQANANNLTGLNVSGLNVNAAKSPFNVAPQSAADRFLPPRGLMQS